MRGQAKRTLTWRVCRRTLVRSSDDTDWDSNRLSGHKALELDALFSARLSWLGNRDSNYAARLSAPN
jgi:hypothetical protein